MKIKIIPHPNHIESVKKDYGKTLKPIKFMVKVKLSDGSIVNLEEHEWEYADS